MRVESQKIQYLLYFLLYFLLRKRGVGRETKEKTLKEVEKERNSIGEATSGVVKNSQPLLAFPM